MKRLIIIALVLALAAALALAACSATGPSNPDGGGVYISPFTGLEEMAVPIKKARKPR